MPLQKIEKIGNRAALCLSEDMLTKLGVGFGDEVEISVVDHKLTVKPVDEIERASLFSETVEKVFKRRASVYRKLAEGVTKQE